MITIKDTNDVVWRLLDSRLVGCTWRDLLYDTIDVNDKVFVTIYWVVPKGWLN